MISASKSRTAWKNNPKRKLLIVKGARQIGKTESIRAFGEAYYESVIEINFVLQRYKLRTKSFCVAAEKFRI